MAKIILTERPSSHRFNEREIIVSAPVKIGRAVAGCKPGNDNGYFNCKVLSRNHAMLWYEDGKFFLQDTQSSNGTFVNNHKLGSASQSSSGSTSSQGSGTLKEDPRNDERWEIYSGDLLQFGVEVVEQAKKGAPPVKHGCILAGVKAYHPDGTEVKAPPSSKYSIVHVPSEGAKVDDQFPVLSVGNLPKLTAQEIYELQAVLQEAQHREVVLEKKLMALNKILAAMEQKDSWSATFQEDLLLSKIQYLEGRLTFFESQVKTKPNAAHQNSRISLNKKDSTGLIPSTFENGDAKTENGVESNVPALLERSCDVTLNSDDYKIAFLSEWKKMLEERQKFEIIAKDAVQRALSEKLETSKALAVAEERLTQIENECGDLQILCEKTQKDLLMLVEKFTTQSETLEEMTQKYQESERVKIDCLEALKEEKSQLSQELDNVQHKLEEGKILYGLLKRENIKLTRKLEGATNGLDEDENSDGEESAINQYPLTAEEFSVPAMSADDLFKGKNVAQLMKYVYNMEEKDFAAAGDEFGNTHDDLDEKFASAVDDLPLKNRRAATDDNKVPKKRSSKDKSYVTDDITFEPQPTADSALEILTGEARRRKEVAGIPTDTGDADIEQFLDGNRQLTELVFKLQAELEAERAQVSLLSAARSQNVDTLENRELVQLGNNELGIGEESTSLLQYSYGKFDNDKDHKEFMNIFDELSNTVASVRSSSAEVAFPSFTSVILHDTSAICSILFLFVWMVFLAYFGAQH